MRPDTTIIGPTDEIRLPEGVGRVTAEAELAVIIGREARNVSEEEAPSVVAATTVLDVTAEDILRRNPRYLTRAKSFDTFFSFGPHLVTPDEVEELGAMEVSTVLNGGVRRKNTVSKVTFSPLLVGLLPLGGDDVASGGRHLHGNPGDGRDKGRRRRGEQDRRLRDARKPGGEVKVDLGPRGKTALGRYGTPEEFARVAAFLASPANGYVTGQAVLVDGPGDLRPRAAGRGFSGGAFCIECEYA